MKLFYEMVLGGQRIIAQDEQILHDLCEMEYEKRKENAKKAWESFEQRLSQYRARRACSIETLEKMNNILKKGPKKLTPLQKSVMNKFKNQQTTKHYIPLTEPECWAFQRFFNDRGMGWKEYPYKPLKFNHDEYPHYQGNLNSRKRKTRKFKQVYVLEHPAEFYV